MGFGRFAAEALSEVAFFKLLSGAWGWVRGMLGDEVKAKAGEEIKKRIIDPKSWDDEHYFALDLAEADAPKEKKKLIELAMKRAQDVDAANGTNYASNFRIIVVCHDNEPTTKGTPAVPEVPAKPAVKATATTPGSPYVPGVKAKDAVPGTKRQGIIILEDLAKNCNDVDEVYARIVAAGLMQDGHSNIEKFFDVCKKVIWPFVNKKMAEVSAAASSVSNSLKEAADKGDAEFEKRLWWKKIPIIGGYL